MEERIFLTIPTHLLDQKVDYRTLCAFVLHSCFTNGPMDFSRFIAFDELNERLVKMSETLGEPVKVVYQNLNKLLAQKVLKTKKCDGGFIVLDVDKQKKYTSVDPITLEKLIKISANSTQIKLFLIINAMVSQSKDGKIQLTRPWLAEKIGLKKSSVKTISTYTKLLKTQELIDIYVTKGYAESNGKCRIKPISFYSVF